MVAAGPGAALREYRRRSGQTQQEVADLAGMSVAGLRDIEQGRVVAPRAQTLRRLAVALGLSPDELEALPRRVGDGEPASPVWIGVLGPLVVRVDGVDIDLGSEVQRVLLGLLALSPNVAVARHRLVARMAAAGRPNATVGGLAARMSRLRRRLRPRSRADGAPAVVAGEGGYALAATDDQLDLLAFQALVREARRNRSAGDLPAAWERYSRAIRLWRGEPLAGLAVLADDPAVVRLMRQWPLVAAEYAAVGAQLDHHDEVVPVLRRVLTTDPLHEAAHALLMVALAGTGRQAEALEVFDTLRRRLGRELGTAPGPELLEAHRRVLRQQVRRPPVAAVRARRTLPPDIAEFTGRTAQLAQLRACLPPDDGASMPVVVAIEGLAGVGKTSLANHFAHTLVSTGRFAEQQLYADLSGSGDALAPDPSAVLASFLHLLGVAGDQLPPELADRGALYRQQLQHTPTLVLLDGAASTAQLAPLLPDTPASLCVVTSRRHLGLAGAHRLTLAEFATDEAVALLTTVLGADRVGGEHAAAVQVVEACGRLPLAVTLAARRLQARPEWTLADLAARLADPRHRLGELTAGGRSVRAALDAACQALPADLRRQLRRLGDHPGSEFTDRSAAAFLGASSATTRRILHQLRGEHLVTALAGNRYRLHSLVRDYLREAW